MGTRMALLAVLLVAAVVRPAAALDLPVAPPPDDLVALALERAPSLAALRARVEEAREMVRPAGALPDPMLELMVQDVGFPRWTVGEEDMSMIGPQLTQGIPFPGKRGARRRVAQADVAVKANELELLRREVARDVREPLRPALRARQRTAGALLRARAARDAGGHRAGALRRGPGGSGKPPSRRSSPCRGWTSGWTTSPRSGRDSSPRWTGYLDQAGRCAARPGDGTARAGRPAHAVGRPRVGELRRGRRAPLGGPGRRAEAPRSPGWSAGPTCSRARAWASGAARTRWSRSGWGWTCRSGARRSRPR